LLSEKRKMNNQGKIALMQILILILGVVAVSYALGSEVGVVRSLIFIKLKGGAKL